MAGFPRITYNGRNIDFTVRLADRQAMPVRDASRESSTSDTQTLNISAGFDVPRVFLRNLKLRDSTDADIYTAIMELKQWADAGYPWVLYRDSAITVNTTLDAAVLASESSIPVVSATGVTSGRRYVIESRDDVATVKASNTATDPVTIANPINFGFASGSRFRDFEVWPMIGSIRIIDRPPLFFDVEIAGQVDRRSL